MFDIVNITDIEYVYIIKPVLFSSKSEFYIFLFNENAENERDKKYYIKFNKRSLKIRDKLLKNFKKRHIQCEFALVSDKKQMKEYFENKNIKVVYNEEGE